MKKITIVPFILMAGFFVSCTSNESEENLTNSTEISLDLKSSLSEKNYEGGCKKMSNIMNTMNTRSCTVTEDMGDSVQVELDFPHKDGNREYFLWIFSKAEVETI